MPNKVTRMQLNIRILIVMLVSVVTGCQFSPDKEDAFTYTALLNHLGGNKAKYLMVRTETLSNSEIKARTKGFESMAEVKENLSQELSNLYDRNSNSVGLSESLTTWSNKVQFIEKEKIQELFSHEKWESLEAAWAHFHKKYPNVDGWLSLSKPGYSSNGESSIIYFEFHCGPLCAEGSFAYLQKKGGVWEVEFISNRWVS